MTALAAHFLQVVCRAKDSVGCVRPKRAAAAWGQPAVNCRSLVGEMSETRPQHILADEQPAAHRLPRSSASLRLCARKRTVELLDACFTRPTMAVFWHMSRVFFPFSSAEYGFSSRPKTRLVTRIVNDDGDLRRGVFGHRFSSRSLHLGAQNDPAAKPQAADE